MEATIPRGCVGCRVLGDALPVDVVGFGPHVGRKGRQVYSLLQLTALPNVREKRKRGPSGRCFGGSGRRAFGRSVGSKGELRLPRRDYQPDRALHRLVGLASKVDYAAASHAAVLLISAQAPVTLARMRLMRSRLPALFSQVSLQ